MTLIPPNAPTAALTSLSPSTIYAGASSTVTVTLTNPNTTATISGVADTISLPAGVTIAPTPGASTSCGGTFAPTAGASSATLSGGTLAPTATCTLTFNITSSTVATHTIPSGTPSATGANAGSAGTTATLTVQTPPNPPTVTAAYTATTIATGASTTLTLTLSNPNSVQLTGIALASSTLPTGLTGSSLGGTCAGGALSSNAISVSGLTLSASSSCTVTVSVTSATETDASPYSYTTGVPTATGPVALTGSAATTATPLTVVAPPTIAVAFSPTSVAVNTVSTLTLTLTNPNSATALSGVAVAGASLPAGLTGSGASSSCGTTSFSGGSLSMSGGSLAGGATCTVTLSVQASAPGTFNYTSGAPSAAGPVSLTGTGATAPTALTVTQAAPTITSLAPTSGTTGGGTSVTITGTGFSNVTGVTFGGTPAAAFSASSSTSIAATAPAHVAGTVDVVVTTAGGTNANTPSDNYTYIAPPSAPAVTTPAPSQRTNNNTPVYSGTAGASLQVDVYVDNSLMGTTTSGAGGAWSITQSPALPDGPHSVHAIAVSSGVPSAQSGTNNFTVDTLAPAAPTVTAPVSGSTTNDNTPTFTGTAEANSTVRVFIDGSFSGNASLTGTNWSYTSTTLPDGSHSFWATATDVAGNLGPQSSTGTLTIDTAAPAAPVINLPTAGASTSSTPTISGTAEANATVGVTIGSTTVTTPADGTGAWSLIWTSLAAGSYSVTATARDAALNISAASPPRSFTVVNAPVASSFTYGSIVPYNIGGDPPTLFSVAGQVTNSPTSYAVGSATTSGGGTVSIDNAGQVSFTPAEGSRGNDSFTYTATNAGGTSAPASVTVTVGNPTFAFTLAGSGTRGAPLSGVQIDGTGGKAPYNCGTSVASGTLPAGTSLNNDCTITGTPTASGSFTFKVTAVDSSTGTGPFTQTSPNLTLVVATPTLTIATNAPTGAAVGDAYSQTNSASGGDTPYTYALASGSLPAGTTLNTTTGTVSGTLTTVGAFSYTVKVTDSQATPATATGTLVSGTIAKGNQTTSFASTAPSSATVGGATYTPTATATSGLPVSLAIDSTSSGVCTKSGAIVSFIGAGTCTINADQPGNPNWNAAQQVQQSFTVAQSAQTINFTSSAPAGAVVGGATYSPAATASSGLAVSFTIAPASSGVCTISGGVVSFTGVGTCAVNADQAGDANWSAAPQVQQAFAVGQGTQTIAFTSTPPAGATVGSATYAPSATATSGLPVTFAIDASASGVCSISGGAVSFTGVGTCVVNANQAGDSNYPAAAQVQQSFAVGAPTIALSPASLPGAAVGTAYNETVSASGGQAPYAFALTAGALPPGLALASDGTLSGTPSAGGTFSFTLTATDSSGGTGPYSGSRAYSVSVGAPTIIVAPASLPNATVGGAYSQAISGSGGTAPYAYAVTAGSLPAGLTLGANGILAGTPTAGGSFTFSVTATDSSGGSGPFTGTSSYTLIVAAPTVTLAPSALPAGEFGTAYSAAITASGGTQPYNFTVTAGALPTGLALAADGNLGGTPTQTGTFNFTISATDSSGGAGPYGGSRAYAIIVTAPTLTIAPAPPTGTQVGAGYSQANQASGGVPPYDYALASGALPAGTTLDPTTGTVSGTPTAAGPFSYAIEVTDSQSAPITATGATVSGTIAQASQTVAFASTPPSPAFVGDTYTPAATASSGLPPTIAIDPSAAGTCTISGGTVTFAGAGTCIVNANQAGNSNVSAAPQVQQSFTVGRRDQTISFTSTAPNPAQVGSTYTPVATASSNLAVAIAIAPSSSGICSLAGGIVTFNSIGTCVINADQAGNATFAPAPQAQQSIAVSTPAAPTASSLSPAAVVRNGPGASVTIELRPLISGEATSVAIDTPPAQGSVLLDQTAFTATYTPNAGYSGADGFTFRALGPGGSSSAASVPIQVIAAVPTAQPRQANVLAGRPITIDLTGSATGAPFIAGALVSVSPSNAADVTLVEGGTAASRSYSVEFTSRANFAGPVTILYTLTNAGGPSAPLTLIVNVESRPDPTADSEVLGLESAQTGAARRATQSQMRNFSRRMEQLHDDAPSGGLAISVSPGIRMGAAARHSEAETAYADPTRLDPAQRNRRSDLSAGAEAGATPEQGAAPIGRGQSLRPRPAAYGVTGDPGDWRGAPAGRAAASTDADASSLTGTNADTEDGATTGPRRREAGSVELWANGEVIVGRRDPVSGQDEFSISTSGITGGADIRLGDGATVGVGAGLGRDHTDIGENGSELHTDSWVVGLYGSFRPVDGAFVDLVVGTGGLDFDITRFVTATGTLATGQREGDLLFGAVTAGIDRRGRSLRWSIYGGIEASQAELGDYAETGPLGYSLIYDERTLDSIAGLFGARFELEARSGRTILVPRGRLEYRYDFEEATGQRVRFTDWLAGPSYSIAAGGWSRHRAAAEIGLGIGLPSDWQLGFDLLGELSGTSRSGGIRIEIAKQF